jgi:hypothetical protein
MDTLRHLALKEKTVDKSERTPLFNRIFLNGVRTMGIQYELGMMLILKAATRDFFSDLDMGIKMILKGKLNLFPHRIRGHVQVKELFKKSEADTD